MNYASFFSSDVTVVSANTNRTFVNSIDVNIMFVLYCAYTNISFVSMIPHEQSVCQHSWRNSCRKQATFLGTEDAYEQFTMQKSLCQSQSGCR